MLLLQNLVHLLVQVERNRDAVHRFSEERVRHAEHHVLVGQLRRFQSVEFLVEDREVGVGFPHVNDRENQRDRDEHRFAAQVGRVCEDQQRSIQQDGFPNLENQVDFSMPEDRERRSVEEVPIEELEDRNLFHLLVRVP